jgi:hypothetical protein
MTLVLANLREEKNESLEILLGDENFEFFISKKKYFATKKMI